MDTVRSLDLMRFVVHYDNILLIIHCKSSDGIACVIGDGYMLIVREDLKVLRIVGADGKRKLLVQKTGFGIDLIHGHRVLACRGTEKMGSVRRQGQS